MHYFELCAMITIE